MTLPTWFPAVKDIVLFGLALWGAVLSTVTWWRTGQRDHRKIRVEIGSGMMAIPGWGPGEPYARVTATNIGHRVVTASSIWLELPEGKRMFSMGHTRMPGMTGGIQDTSLPATLTDGQSALLWMAYGEIGRTLASNGIEKTKIFAVCEDSTGTKHRSEPWVVDARELISMSE